MVFYFCSLNNYTSTSKLRHLACQVSFLVYISRNIYFIFFKHPIIDSISSVCLASDVVNTSSCQTATFFTSSTTWVNVISTIAKFYYKTFKVSLTSLSSTWIFFYFCWVSSSSWSNYLWAYTRHALFFSHSYLWASYSRGSIRCLAHFHSYSIVPCKCSNSKENYRIFLGMVYSTFTNKPWCFILNKHACQVLLGYFICLAISDYVYRCQLRHKDCFQFQLDFI